MITFDDFKKLDIRIGKILTVEKIENSDKLLRLEVDFGEEAQVLPEEVAGVSPKRDIRQIVSGIAEFYTPEDLIGKEAPFCINLEPKVLRGVESRGMIMAVSALGKPVLLHPGESVPPGSIVK